MSHLIDHNDHAHIERLGYRAKGWVPGGINHTKLALGGNQFISVFHVKPVYYETITGHWRPLSEITTNHGNKFISLKPEAMNKMSPRFMRWLIKRQHALGSELVFDYGVLSGGLQPRHLVYNTTLTVYPDPNADPDPDTPTFDGGMSDSWAHTQTSLSGVEGLTTSTSYTNSNANLQDSTVGVSVGYQKAGNTYHHVYRSGTLFATSSIGTDSIDSATYSLYGNAKSDGMADAYAYGAPVSLSTSSNTGWTSSDYTLSNWGYASPWASGITYASFSTTGYNDWTLNATGEAGINKTGITKIGVMDGHEIEQQNWTGSATISYFIARSADQTGTSNDPKLVVVHTAAASTFIPKVMFF